MVGTALGSIDRRYRPLFRIARSEDDDEFVALLDTGFNGELMCDMAVVTVLDIQPSGRIEEVELAGGVKLHAQYGWMSIQWLGRPRRVSVLVAAIDENQLAKRNDEPVALVGGALLAPSLVLLDYNAGVIEIEETS